MSKVKMSFEPEIAKIVGTDAAIILSNIDFWVDTNRANKINFHDGQYWTFNSIKAFTEQFTWLTESQIKTCLINLHKAKLILVSNHNKKGYDRTKWYSTPIESTISEKSQMEKTEITNAIDEIRQPIPDNKPYISLLKIKMCLISISTDNKLITHNRTFEIDPKDLQYFDIAQKFRLLFIKNLKAKEAPITDQEKATYKNYVDPIRLCIEKDKCTLEQLKEVYRFLNSDDGEFWKNNILSTAKLREKMAKLILAKNSVKLSKPIQQRL